MRKTNIGKMLDDPKKWYLDYVNNFVTFGGFCSYYGLVVEEGLQIIREGKKIVEAAGGHND